MRTLLLTLPLLLPAAAAGTPLFPDTGTTAVYQHALELGNRQRVLSVALRPGHEDLGTLATLRLGHGARLVTVFVTNGESGGCDTSDCPPADVAVIRREAAAAALRTLGAGALFWNFPDIAAAPSREYALARWNPDTLRARLREIVLQYRPDVILVHDDPETSGGASLPSLLAEQILDVCADIRPRRGGKTKETRPAEEVWNVGRIWVELPDGSGLTARASKKHPVMRRAYDSMAETAGDVYHPFSIQRREWAKRAPGGGYRLVAPAERTGEGERVSLTDGVSPSPGARLRSIERAIGRLSARLRRNPGSSRASLQEVSTLIDSVDLRLAFAFATATPDRRVLLDWKQSLEDLRATLLGVTVRWRASETTLTERQLTYVSIDTVTGPIGTGTTEIYVPGTAQGWILNEQLSQRLPLQFTEPYRLISPASVAYDLPAGWHHAQRSTVFHSLVLYIIHKGEKREENFLKRFDIPVRFAPRFTAEVLTPIVRCIQGEEVVVRLTNNSRDGTADALRLDDSLVTAGSAGFRLSTKGSSAELTLALTCGEEMPAEGEAVIPLSIGNHQVGRFLARRFVVDRDPTRRVGLVTGKVRGAVADALRRAGFDRVTELDSSALMGGGALDTIDVVVVDRRANMLLPWLRETGDLFRSFVSNGGHLLVLAQNESEWPEYLERYGFRRPQRVALPPETQLLWDSTHLFVRTPNDLRGRPIVQPVFRAAWQRPVLDPADQGIDVVARSTQGDPLLVSRRVGAGRVTYAAVELVPQWMSVQPGALRLLANMLSL